MPFSEREQGLFLEIRQLNAKCRELQAQVDELSKRPEIVAIDIETNPHERRYIGTRDFDATLKPGKCYIVCVKEHSSCNKKRWVFKTPMMLVETPDIIVDTEDLNTPIGDILVATKMRQK